ncbi:16S rRNA (cytidine(1402)-2'-O)-methyltransferase [Candidatus Shapirobacteria bacterium CG10_big_fil_rev_8_21_14_0_10_40_9]|uniref:Ribosomal RNA small subunit methyltransferase I n=1 Tax=Candidatus Shapirobacteria bacterium CG10_big_fil_rev_8_21_14_0_10_40_9 TaxID=1974888 RepID=A0A2M8L410_9BACT|nr:MAG: 16S rRNA (cytidine(1402)-2'-O)-methyltransferase [Candidatus Shapirobacteria bacterium CG10_big_fil_rev_8_21_14_0_10_40_9]
MGKLYIVSTPIGNLEDITLRAKRILEEVDIIACEDTRKTGMLLTKLTKVPPSSRWNLNKRPQFLSYYEENELQRIPEIIQLLKEGKNVALVSNAGTPTISDPGFKLVRECLNQGVQVEAIPGSSAILTALVSSGLPTDKFLFLGYLPKKQGKRQELLKNCKLLTVHCTLIFFESPYRLLETLKELREIFGDIDIVICRELTKIHEEIRREKISQSILHFEKNPAKGEVTLLFNIPQG